MTPFRLRPEALPPSDLSHNRHSVHGPPKAREVCLGRDPKTLRTSGGCQGKVCHGRELHNAPANARLTPTSICTHWLDEINPCWPAHVTPRICFVISTILRCHFLAFIYPHRHSPSDSPSPSFPCISLAFRVRVGAKSSVIYPLFRHHDLTFCLESLASFPGRGPFPDARLSARPDIPMFKQIRY